MSQISPPVRILLIGAVVFLAAWFTVLRPKPAVVEPVTTTPPPANVTQPKTATAATTAPAAKPEATASGVPAEALAKLPKDVARALEAKKVLVLGVFSDDAKRWRPISDDDRYVRNELRHTNRYDGDVFVKQVGITDLATYGPLINDLHVSQSPSIVVIDGNLKGTVLTGYVDRIAINQALADAHDATREPDITDPYLRTFNKTCAGFDLRAERWSFPTLPGRKANAAAYQRGLTIVRDYRAVIAAKPAPAKYRAMRAEWLKVMDQTEAGLLAQVKAAKAGKDTDSAAVVALYAQRDATSARLDRRFNDAGVTNCAINRRS